MIRLIHHKSNLSYYLFLVFVVFFIRINFIIIKFSCFFCHTIFTYCCRNIFKLHFFSSFFLSLILLGHLLFISSLLLSLI